MGKKPFFAMFLAVPLLFGCASQVGFSDPIGSSSSNDSFSRRTYIKESGFFDDSLIVPSLPLETFREVSCRYDRVVDSLDETDYVRDSNDPLQAPEHLPELVVAKTMDDAAGIAFLNEARIYPVYSSFEFARDTSLTPSDFLDHGTVNGYRIISTITQDSLNFIRFTEPVFDNMPHLYRGVHYYGPYEMAYFTNNIRGGVYCYKIDQETGRYDLSGPKILSELYSNGVFNDEDIAPIFYSRLSRMLDLGLFPGWTRGNVSSWKERFLAAWQASMTLRQKTLEIRGGAEEVTPLPYARTLPSEAEKTIRESGKRFDGVFLGRFHGIDVLCAFDSSSDTFKKVPYRGESQSMHLDYEFDHRFALFPSVSRRHFAIKDGKFCSLPELYEDGDLTKTDLEILSRRSLALCLDCVSQEDEETALIYGRKVYDLNHRYAYVTSQDFRGHGTAILDSVPPSFLVELRQELLAK